MKSAKGTNMASMMVGTACRQVEGLFDVESGSVVGLDDAALWERFADRRDEVAFAALVERHGSMVLATARGILADHHAAEDVFQTTFVALARRGGTIRRFETLAPWLHRVACREAIRVRVQARRRSEREQSASPRSPDRTPDRAEVEAAVHAELDRLPASYRLPIVLCDLEGWTKASAAVHLGWTEGAVRGRLERGRARLRSRLTRQGFAPAVGSLAALGGWGAEASSAARLAPGLVAAAVRAASAIGPVGSVAGLVLGATTTPVGSGPIGRGLLALSLAGSVGLAGLAGWAWWGRAGVIAPAPTRSAELPPAASQRSTPPPALAAPPAVVPVGSEKPGDLVDVLGQVVAPDGQPVGGASVRLKPHVSMFPHPRETHVVADASGRFTLPVPRHLLIPSEWASAVVVAQAPGWGLGYVTLGDAASPGADRVTIRLTQDDAPLEGRIIDLEGKAVIGASVRVGRLCAPTTSDLTAWTSRIRLVGALKYWPEQSGVNSRELIGLGEVLDLVATTDLDGRFRLAGLGRERLVSLIISARDLATTEVHATTQTRGPITTTDHGESMPPVTIHSSRVDIALPPGRAVAGVIRDADTGASIAGVSLSGQVLGGYDEYLSLAGIEAVSDDQGRYRLEGLPMANRYRISVRPGHGQPYLSSTIATRPPEVMPVASSVPTNQAATGIKPAVIADMALRRGVIIRGRLIDKATGRPVVDDASVEIHAMLGSPEIARYPNLDPTMSIAETDADGVYEVVALPGPGLLTVRASGSWKQARNYESMEGFDPKMQQLRMFPTAESLHFCNAVVLIRPHAGMDLAVDIAIESGGTVRGTLVDPDGRPLVGTTSRGLQPIPTPSGLNSTASFEARGFDPIRPRRVDFFHKERQLAASVVLRGDEAEPVVVRLAPSSSVTGRLVNEHGEPLAGYPLIQILPDVETPGQGNLPPGQLISGDDGRFRIEGLIPGLLYRVYPTHDNALGDPVLKDFAPRPGATDLGDIKLRPFPSR